MRNRYVVLIFFCEIFLFSQYVVSADQSLIDSLFTSGSSSDSASDDQLLGSVFGVSSGQSIPSNTQTPVVTTPTSVLPTVTNPGQSSSVSTSSASSVPVVSTTSSSSQQANLSTDSSTDIISQINTTLNQNESSIAQGINQRVEGSTDENDDQKKNEEQMLIGEFADDPALVKYLQNYVSMFGDAKYTQAGQAFTTNVQAIQGASFSQLASISFLQQTIKQSESNLADLYTAYTNYGLHPDITLDNVFTRAFFDVVQLYGIYVEALANYVGQIAISGNIVAADIINLVKCMTLILASFDSLKGRYFANQQQLVQNSGSLTVAAETIFADKILLVAAISAKQLFAHPYLNHYDDCALALGWAQLVNLFGDLPNSTYPHTQALAISVSGYQTWNDYLQEVCGNLVKVLDDGVRTGSNHNTGSATNNKANLDALRNYYNTALQMYAFLNTDASKAAATSLQNYFTVIDQLYSDAFKQEVAVTAAVNAARQTLQTPGQSLAQIESATAEFSSAVTSYQSLISTFNSISDETDSAYCNQMVQQLAGDAYIGLACVYWQRFLHDAQAGGGLVSTLPISVTNSNFASVLTSLQSMCSNAVSVLSGNQNPYHTSANDTTTSIAQMYKNALDSYSGASIQVSTAGAVSASAAGPVDSIMKTDMINAMPNIVQAVQTYFQSFGQAIQALQSVSSSNASAFQASVAQALSAAANLQSLNVQYPLLAQFLAPVGEDWSNALISTLTAIFQAQTFGSQNLLQYMYGSVLQSSAQYMTASQKSAMSSLLTQLGSQVNISTQVQQAFQAAQAATNAATAIPLWNTALNLAQTNYTLGKGQASLQDSAARLVTYITIVQAYINFALLKTTDFATALTIYRVAAQAYCATQACSQANVTLPSTITTAALGQLVIQAAHNATNTGVLDFIKQDIQNFITQTDPAAQLQAQTKLQNDMQQLATYIANQQNDWVPFTLQAGTTFTSLMSQAAGNSNSYVYTVTTAEGATTNYTISNYSSVMQPATLLQADAAFQAGQTATAAGNFTLGAQSYSQAAQLFYNASSCMTDPVAIKNAQNQYYLSQTRMQASGVAALIQPCSFMNLGNFTNIPTAYVVSSAQINIDPSLVGTLPASLNKTQTTPLSAQQFSDFLNVLQRHIVYSCLQGQGLNPSTYYQAGSLTKIVGLSDSHIAVVAPYEKTAQNYAAQLQAAFTAGLQSGSKILKLTATCQLQPAGGLAVLCTNLPIPLLIPVTPNGYTAGAYYIGAYQLFQPGTALLQFGSQIYVPGQDVATAGLLLQYIMQLYLGCAYNYGQIATTIYNQFSSQLSSIEDVTALQDQINTMNIAYQNGIAYIQSNSNSQNTAYGYAVSLAALNASYSSYPANVNQYIVNVYTQWAGQLEACLVGDPSSSGYQNVLATLNGIYMQQANVMPSVANQSNQNIAAAFKKAGDACMIFEIEDPINGRVSVYPYDTASGYYNAALQQYQTLQDTANQNAMNQQLNIVSMCLAQQYAKLYYDVKNNGTKYLDASGRGQTITWNKLSGDYLQYANSGTNLGASQVMDSGELAEYNRVKNLLLNAAINCSYVQNAVSTSSAGSSAPTAADQSQNNTTIINSLTKFNTVFANLATAGFDFTNESIRTNVLIYAAGEYNLFVATQSVLLSFLSQLSSAISYQYIYDYLGGLPASTASNYATALQTEWTQFFTALQNEAESLQNPSSSYLG